MKEITNGLEYFLNNENCAVAMLGKQYGNEISPTKTYLIIFQDSEQISATDDISVYNELKQEIPLPCANKTIDIFGKTLAVMFDGTAYHLIKKENTA